MKNKKILLIGLMLALCAVSLVNIMPVKAAFTHTPPNEFAMNPCYGFTTGGGSIDTVLAEADHVYGRVGSYGEWNEGDAWAPFVFPSTLLQNTTVYVRVKIVFGEFNYNFYIKLKNQNDWDHPIFTSQLITTSMQNTTWVSGWYPNTGWQIGGNGNGPMVMLWDADAHVYTSDYCYIDQLVIEIDTNQPSITNINPANATWSNTGVISITASDAEGSVDKVWFSYNGANHTVGSGPGPHNINYTFPEGTTNIVIYVNDTSNNILAYPYTVKYDKTAPQFNIISPTSNTPTYSPVILYTLKDTTSGVDRIKFELNGVNYTVTEFIADGITSNILNLQTLTGNKLKTGANNFKIYVLDNAGNVYSENYILYLQVPGGPDGGGGEEPVGWSWWQILGATGTLISASLALWQLGKKYRLARYLRWPAVRALMGGGIILGVISLIHFILGGPTVPELNVPLLSSGVFWGVMLLFTILFYLVFTQWGRWIIVAAAASILSALFLIYAASLFTTLPPTLASINYVTDTFLSVICYEFVATLVAATVLIVLFYAVEKIIRKIRRR